MRPAIRLLLALVALASLLAPARAQFSSTFPSLPFETAFSAVAATVPAGANSDDHTNLWQITTSWPTESGRLYVIEARLGGGEWKPRSEPFVGDGKPIDFQDLFKAEGPAVTYRMISGRVSDHGDTRASMMNPGFLWDPSLHRLVACLEFLAGKDLGYLVRSSTNTTSWKNVVQVIERSTTEVTVEDPAFSEGATYYYRVEVFRKKGSTAPVLPPDPHARSQDLKHIASPTPSEAKREQTAEAARQEQATQEGTLAHPNRIVRSLEFTTKVVPTLPGTQFIVIDMGLPGGDPVGFDGPIILQSKAGANGQRDMIALIDQVNYNLSDMTGVRFRRILAIDESGAAVGTVMENGVEEVLGFRITPLKNHPPKLVPLTAEELRNFKFIKYVPDATPVDVYIDGVPYTLDRKNGLVKKPEATPAPAR